MANYNKTPLLRPIRKEGGTLYVFPSATEDIGLNINSRSNKVALSYYALLDLPRCSNNFSGDSSIAAGANSFQTNLIGGRYSLQTSSMQIDGSKELAMSLQNYMMNFETTLRNQDGYNYQLAKTVSERVFWKWLKETAAINWQCVGLDDVYGMKIYKEGFSDSSLNANYKRVVKCFGEIAAGNSASSEFGMFNEVYVSVPSSYGETEMLFAADEDDNYSLGNVYSMSDSTGSFLEGRSDTRLLKKDYGIAQVPFTDYVETGDNNVANIHVDEKAIPWYNEYNMIGINGPKYVTDDAIVGNSIDEINSSINFKMVAEGLGSFYRSKLDAVSIVKDLDIYDNYFYNTKPSDYYDFGSLNWDKVNTTYSLTKQTQNLSDSLGKFDFNAVLLYYTVYEPNNSTEIATNLFGILFLDGVKTIGAGSPDITGFNIPQSYIEKTTKKMSTEYGFGNGFSFRVNIRTSSIYDNADALISDSTTSNSVLTDDFNDVVHALQQSVRTLENNTYTIRTIVEEHKGLKAHVSGNDTKISELEKSLNEFLQHKYEKFVIEDGEVSGILNVNKISNGKADAETPINFYVNGVDENNFITADPVISIREDKTIVNHGLSVLGDMTTKGIKQFVSSGAQTASSKAAANDYLTVAYNELNTLNVSKVKSVEEDDKSFKSEWIISKNSPFFAKSEYKGYLEETSIDSNYYVDYIKLIPLLIAYVKKLNDLITNKAKSPVTTSAINDFQTKINKMIIQAESKVDATINEVATNAAAQVNDYKASLAIDRQSFLQEAAAAAKTYMASDISEMKTMLNGLTGVAIAQGRDSSSGTVILNASTMQQVFTKVASGEAKYQWNNPAFNSTEILEITPIAPEEGGELEPA